MTEQVGFDTIKLRLNNTNKYSHIYSKALQLAKTKSELSFTKYKSDDVFKVWTAIDKEGLKKDIAFAKHELGSAFYGIVVNENALEKTLTLEFSIPKFFYKTNVFDYPNERVNNIAELYQSLEYAIQVFFYNELDVHPYELNFNDIEIIRLDLCINLHFQSRKALDLFFKYCDHNLKLDELKKRNYDNNTLMYYTKGYSFKMYKKKDDYLVHDYVRLKNRNRDLADSILHTSDKVLRFEMTIRKSKMNSVFLNNLGYSQKIRPEFKKHYLRLQKVYKLINSEIEKIFRVVDYYFNLRKRNEIEIEQFKLKMSELTVAIFKDNSIRFLSNFLINVWSSSYTITREEIRSFVCTEMEKRDFNKFNEYIRSKEYLMTLTKFQLSSNYINPKQVEFNYKYLELLVKQFEDLIDRSFPKNQMKSIKIDDVLLKDKELLKELYKIPINNLVAFLHYRNNNTVDKVNENYPARTRRNYNKMIKTIQEHYNAQNIDLTNTRFKLPQIKTYERISK